MTRALPPLHYRHPNHLLGDVHPIYNSERHRWFLYYLAPGGHFHSRLVSSRDFRYWREEHLRFDGTPRANYFVVAPLHHHSMWYSWYGQHDTHVCSQSSDGQVWQANPSLDIPVQLTHSHGGERDPYIVYDDDRHCFYTVALSYLSTTFDCAISIASSQGDQLDRWNPRVHSMLRFANGPTWSSGEPECPQLIKINRRWYLFASLARRTIHHVGGLSYWIGDLDCSPLDVDWSTKPRHELTSEDLCAAQVALKEGQCYVFGWIPPQAKGNQWGGHLNLPLRVRVGRQGILSTYWSKSAIKGAQFHELEKVEQVESWQSSRSISAGSYLQLKATWGARTCVRFSQEGHSALVCAVDGDRRELVVYGEDDYYVYSSIRLPEHLSMDHEQSLEVIVENDILEANFAQVVTLHARLPRAVVGDSISVTKAQYQSIIWSMRTPRVRRLP